MSFFSSPDTLPEGSRTSGRPPALAGAHDVLHEYRPPSGGYDEMIDGRGNIRPHWHDFLNGFAKLGADGRQAAADATTRHVRESGIAFNVHADPEDRRHTWRLDLVPLILTDGEWSRLSKGLVQRARLVEAALKDLYGPRRLLLDGHLPARPFLGAREFVRPEVGIEGQHRFLHTYACDIARTRTGDWVVLADQTDADIGAGYVIASRVALSHGLAGLFGSSHARRLAGFYRSLQETLQAQLRRDDSRIALLSTGPDDPCYFSHAYLARYLGYNLVESADLTIRDDYLYLKTLDGLQRIDLLLRKVGGAGLDPLFLPGVAGPGIAGLLQTVRNRGLVVANALGAALAQHRALAPWSAELARVLLGEDLLLADAPSYWLGEAGALPQVEGRWDQLRLMQMRARNDPGVPLTMLDPRSLSRQEHDKLLANQAVDGWRTIAVPPVELATAPSFEHGRLYPRPFAIRCFLARDGDDWHVLPGGLVRMAGSAATTALPNGYGTKDLWITSSASETQQLSLLRATMGAVHLRRTGTDLLSRTADNLFWLGRYAERAEARMRLLRSVLSRTLEDRNDDADPILLGRLLAPEEEAGVASSAPAGLEEMAYLALFEGPYSLRASLDHLHRTATLVRDQVSHDAWRMLNSLWIDRGWRDIKRIVMSRATLDLLDSGIRSLNAFAGTEAENMTRNFAWRFLELGRRLERAAEMATLVQRLIGLPALGQEEGDRALRLLLELGDSFMTYRSRYMMTPLLLPVLDLLLLDETNPRSIAYQLVQIEDHLAALPSDGPYRTAEHRLILKILTRIRLVEVNEIAWQDQDRGRPHLDALMEELGRDLPALSDLLVHSHFAHGDMPMSMLADNAEETAQVAATP